MNDFENELNLDLSKPHISREEITNIINTRPKDINLYRRAFVHKSIQKYIKNSDFLVQNVQEYMKESFERLEFVGDATFNLIVAKILYEKYPDKDEGFLTRIRTKIVRGTNCSKLSKNLNLSKYILISSKIKDNNAFDKLLEDIFEALIGAIFLDLGYDATEEFIRNLLDKFININEFIESEDNYKDLIMRFTQFNGYELPIYDVVSIEGQPHNRLFTVSLKLKKNRNTNQYGSGKGFSKKEAEQQACKDAICFNELKDCSIHNCKSYKIHLNELENLIHRDKI